MAGHGGGHDDAATKRPRTRSLPERAVSGEAGDGFAVVGIGASAGGLEAFQKLFDAMPPDSGMAFILIQHLDPTHESLMVELLAKHTAMEVQHAADGMPLLPDRVYVIPPGVYLSVVDGTLRLSEPRARRGARLPFDFLLKSLAEELGERAVGVVLSGTGADGSLGLKAVKEECGLVIAQDPGEADHDGMPRSAIMTGAVDLVLPVAEIPEALARYHRRIPLMRTRNAPGKQDTEQSPLADIIELLRTRTGHDFSLYKPGTLLRRIHRRMAMSALETDEIGRYLEELRDNAPAADLLAKELLINVTGFFRDPEVFDLLAKQTVPDLVRNHPTDRPLRIWVAGCSTGEETYSIAMLFLEEIEAAGRQLKLQIFASDADADAVATARDGVYPESIEAEVSPERIARFFTREEHSYRVTRRLRDAVVFAVHDILADPPFARLDMISCRNVLIYLQPKAQAKVVSLFHFALHEEGILLLGTSETAGNADNRFEAISKSGRLYRHIGRRRPGGEGFSMRAGNGAPPPPREAQDRPGTHRSVFADLCQRLVTENFAPAAVLINRRHEYLYSLGPTDAYLRAVPGYPTNDVFVMARTGVRAKLRAAVRQAIQENGRVEVSGGQTSRDGKPLPFRIIVQPVQSESEELLLVCFIDEPQPEREPVRAATKEETSQVAELEQELETTRTELAEAVHDLGELTRSQTEATDAALSINEEYQAANEELETSKEELQSLNEELTALNSQLHETLERERTTADDLQNVLYSTDIATIFLDNSLNIRFFTPATNGIFSIIPSDVGRPLGDLRSLVFDEALLVDAHTVLVTDEPIQTEVGAGSGRWYMRRIVPYRTRENGVEGVVITFTDTTEQRRARELLETARQEADRANAAKSRFLAAASHDIRQPLQTISLLQGLLGKTVTGKKAQILVGRLGETLTAMTAMLNTLLDLNRIEAGNVEPEIVGFHVDVLLERLKDEFAYHAEAQGLALRVVPCSGHIHSDPHLLEQMLRNLLSNAVKYTERGKVLLGCRRRDQMLSIEVWDTGIGIVDEELEAIFDEYHQLDNTARETGRGLGLGLSIVKGLADILGHRVHVRSHPGGGSVFAIEIEAAPGEVDLQRNPDRQVENDETNESVRRTGAILVVEDDTVLRELLVDVLADEGHRPYSARDGPRALELIARGAQQPDLVVADYNLPGGMNGFQVAEKLQARLNRMLPVIVLTGDISEGARQHAAHPNCAHLTKPVKLTELTQLVRRLLPPLPTVPRPHAREAGDAGDNPSSPLVYVVEDDKHVQEELREVLEGDGRIVETFPTAEAFLEAYRPGREGCLLLDAHLPGMDGLELLEHLDGANDGLTIVMITGRGDVAMAVRAMKAGASDFMEKPIGYDNLIANVEHALELSRNATLRSEKQEDAARLIARLTPRQRQIMDMVLAGHPSKNIAADLGISQRTVENHRASIMKRTETRSLPALARLTLAAAEIQGD